jgi:hypothetical protein
VCWYCINHSFYGHTSSCANMQEILNKEIVSRVNKSHSLRITQYPHSSWVELMMRYEEGSRRLTELYEKRLWLTHRTPVYRMMSVPVWRDKRHYTRRDCYKIDIWCRLKGKEMRRETQEKWTGCKLVGRLEMEICRESKHYIRKPLLCVYTRKHLNPVERQCTNVILL